MNPIKIPPEHKDKFHLKDEDLDRINIHIVRYEEEYKKKKKSRIWVWVLAGIILFSVILLEVIDISFIKRFLGIKKFSIKGTLVVDGDVINFRFSKPLKNKVQVIIEPIKVEGSKRIVLLSGKATNEITVNNKDVKVLMLEYEKEITISTGSDTKKINLEDLEELK